MDRVPVDAASRPAPDDAVAERALLDGRRLRIVNVFYDAPSLEQRLQALAASAVGLTPKRCA